MILSTQKFLREKTSVFLCAVIAIVLVMSASISLSTDAYALSPNASGGISVGSQISQKQILVDSALENVDCEEIVISEDCCDDKGEQPCPNSSDCKTVCTNANAQLPIIQYLLGNLRRERTSLRTAPSTAIHGVISPDINAPPPRG